jgi:phosphatidylglycerophosphatase A
MKFRERAVLFLATGFFIGTVPFAPGTFGSIIGLPICFLISRLDILIAVICTILFILFAIWMAAVAEKALKKKDAGEIVIDEIAGLIVTFIGIPFTLKTVIVGFIIFRAFDGPGIVLDDVLAGLYANLILRLAIYITGII